MDLTIGAPVLALQKTSAVAYLRAVMEAWRRHVVVMPVEDVERAALPGVPIAERMTVQPGGGWFDETIALDDDPAPAQISFTSGTTGRPKPILISRRALSDVTRRLIDVMEMDESIREYIGVPVTFSFGLGRARAVAAAGGRSYLPERGFRADELARMLGEGEVNALSAVPTLLRLLIQQRELFNGVGERLRWLEIGSQYMSAEEKAAIRAIFPRARIVQHYGLTEASRTTFLVIDEVDGDALESVGMATGDAQVRIDEEGRIAVRGPHVADGMLTETGLKPLIGDDGWLHTNDLGEIRSGRLFFKGRVDHLINVSGIKVPAELFEQRLAERLGEAADGVAVAGRPDPLRGEAVLVAYLAHVDTGPLREAAHGVAQGFGLGAADIALVPVPAIPRTETGKVQRGALASVQMSPVNTVLAKVTGQEGEVPLNEREAEIAAIWREVLGVPTIGRDESFFDVGGDSLSAINVMIRMEQAGLPKSVTQQIFDGRTIAEIAGGGAGPAPGRSLAADTTDAINATRGVLVLIVILAHWGPFMIERMGSWSSFVGHWINPFFRLGTPGFAMVFGLGLGYFQSAMAVRNPERLRAKLRSNTLVVASGVGLLAACHLIALLLSGGGLGPQWPTELFYSVLFFYLLMVPTSGYVLWLIGKTRYAICNALALAGLAVLVAYFCQETWGAAETQGWVNLGRLMLVAKYAYPRMLAEVLLGVAIGLWIRTHNDRPDLARSSASGGVALLVGGVALSISTGLADQWFAPSATEPMLIAYSGIIMLLFAGGFALLRSGRLAGTGLSAMRLMILIGLLSFAAYVGHTLVMVVKDILVLLHLPYALALLLSVGTFVLGAAEAIRRLHRLYFGGGPREVATPVVRV